MGPVGYPCGCERRFANADTHANTYCDPDRDSNSNSNTDRYCETQSNSAVSPHTGTAAITGKASS